MSAGAAAVRPPALLLPGDGLRALLHDGVRVLDVVLAGSQGGELPPGQSHLSSCFVLFTVVILVLNRGVTILPSSLSANQRPVLGHVITLDQLEASVPSSTTNMPPATCSLSEY